VRRGRIQRVERSGGTQVPLRVCPITTLAPNRLTCFTRDAPRIGTSFALVNGKGFEGVFKSVAVSKSDQDECGIGSAHEVTLGGGAEFARNRISLGVQGMPVGPRARIMLRSGDIISPSGRKSEKVWLSLDADGDDQTDMIATAYDCPPPIDAPAVPSGRTMSTMCIDYWRRVHGRWLKLTQDLFLNCR
jgi:hypothetical protein